MSVKVKKKNANSIYFVILLTFISLVSCQSKKYYNYKIEGKKINVNQTYTSDEKIDQYIAPYRNHITKDLDSVLAISPINLEKSSGKWETNIGLLMAKVTYDLGNPVFEKREEKTIDMVLLNHGGIRSIIPKGNVTSRTAYNVMPFENSLIVVVLTGLEVKQLANYILTEKKPHPMYGIQIFYTKSTNEVTKVEINGKTIEDTKIYNVATSDYLSNGGDNMTFFRDSNLKYDLDYKLRNLLIDYFKKVDTLEILDTKIVIEE
jgi:2',3'-cyclic-nucleotide 2'-phosphodiesterase (5'-nucleotidase family)